MSKLDWGHGLTNGLVFAYVPTSRSSIDHVSGKAPTTFGGTVSTTEHPMRFVSGNADFGRTGLDDITTEGTVIALVDWDATSTGDAIISSGENIEGHGFEFWMDDASYVSHGLIVETFNQRRTSDWDIFDSNRFYTVGAAWGGSDCRFYVDGVLKTTDSGAAISPTADSARTTRVGIAREGSHQLIGKIAYVYAWNRKLNAAEIAAVTAEPYQFFIGTPEFVAVEPRSDTFRLLEPTAAPATGPVITDVNTTNTWADGATGLVVTGTGFM